HEFDIIDPPQRVPVPIRSETAQLHVAGAAFSPPTIRVTVAEFVEQPHNAFELHE
ncbi:unnamed protein product, partial [Rotaria magnacalcarata]